MKENIITSHVTGYYVILLRMSNPRKITATEFKAKCLEILDHLGADGIVVTKRGKPVARVLPERTVRNLQFIGSMKGKIEIAGDIYETGSIWDAQS